MNYTKLKGSTFGQLCDYCRILCQSILENDLCFFFFSISLSSIPLNSPIFRVSKDNNKIVGNRPVGWVRGQEDPSPALVPPIRQYGLALLRLAECAAAIASGDKLVADLSGTAHVPEATPADVAKVCILQPFAPSWWPEDIAIGLPRIQSPLAPSF